MLRLNLARPRFQWVTTGVTTRHGEPRGWRLHAVMADEHTAFAAIRWRPSACGHSARWGGDLFVEQKCARCLRALGLACAVCRGTGAVDTGPCGECANTGENPESLAIGRARENVFRLRERRRTLAEWTAEEAATDA